jgi:AcrR family transcriptional regulator
MEAIASMAGVAKQTVYSHFANKETLFRAIIEGVNAGGGNAAFP